MSEITLQELNDSLTPERVIQLVLALGADRYEEKSDYIIFPSLCHNSNVEDASMKLYYYKANKLFHCYSGCGESFNIFGLFERRYNTLGIEYNFYQDIVLKIADGIVTKKKDNGFYFPYESQYDKFKIQVPQISFRIYNPNFLNIFSNYMPQEWLNEGISEESLHLYNIRYCISQNKIIIPHYNKNGELIGIRGRALNDEDIEIGKYMPITIEGHCYAHSLGYNLYGLNLVKDNLKKYKTAIVVEGEKSCMLYDSMFGHDKNICVAACGSQLHNYQVQLLLNCGVEKIIVAFDKEGEDWKEKEKYFNKLNKMCSKYKNLCEIGFIYDNQNLLKLKDSPLDEGKETFIKLFNKVVYVK
jgi:hypothetical protein